MSPTEHASSGSDPRTVAHRAWACLAVGDMEGILQECADDVVWRMVGLEDLLPNQGLFEGKRATREFMSMGPKLYDFSRLELVITATYVDGPFVIIEFTMDTPVLNGRHHHDDRIIVLKIVEGKIVRAHEYAGTLKVKTDLLAA